jgi:hypothetical protein
MLVIILRGQKSTLPLLEEYKKLEGKDDNEKSEVEYWSK